MKFMKIGAVRGIFYLRALFTFYPYFLHFPCDLDKIGCGRCVQKFVDCCEFRKIRRGASHTLLAGVKDYLSMFSTFYLA
jgi:hypothetical protein